MLTKTDLADSEPLTSRLHHLNPDALLLRAMHDAIDAKALFTADLFGGSKLGARHSSGAVAPQQDAPLEWRAPTSHSNSIHSFAVTLDGAVDWTMFGVWLSMLLHRHGASVLRGKGILNVGAPTRPSRSMACSIWCIRRGTCRPGRTGITLAPGFIVDGSSGLPSSARWRPSCAGRSC